MPQIQEHLEGENITGNSLRKKSSKVNDKLSCHISEPQAPAA